MPLLLHRFLAGAALAAAPLAALESQDSAPAASGPAASRPATSPASAPATDPREAAARALLREAARRRAPAGEPEIRDVTISFEVETNLEGRHNEAEEATHQFLRPNRIRTQIQSSAARIERGFDGSTYWLRRADRVAILSGRDTIRDREEIDGSVRFTDHMLQLVSLGSLAERLEALDLLAEPAKGVRGRIAKFPSLRAGDVRPADVELRFDPKSLDLVEVRAFPISQNGERAAVPESIAFADVREVLGVRFPHRLTAWTKSKDLPEYRLQILRVAWNDALAPELFAPPKE